MTERQDEREFCATGLWVDHATGNVVDSPPATGTQLVPPGGELRPDRKAAVAAARAAAPAVVESSVTDPESEGDTPAAKKAPARKAAAPKKG